MFANIKLLAVEQRTEKVTHVFAFWSAQVHICMCTLPMHGSVLKICVFTRSRMSALGWPWLDWCASSPWLWRARQRNTTKQCKAWTVNSAQCFVPSASAEPVLNVKGSVCLGEPRLPFRSSRVLSCVALLLPRRAFTFPLWSREWS